MKQKEPSSTDEKDLMAWVASANPGDQAYYHIGDLATDRERAWRMNDIDGREDRINDLARRALALAANGDIHLVQRRIGRVGEGVFKYIAIRRATRSISAR